MRYTISFPSEMASSYPRNLSYIVKQLSNYNRVGYKVLPLSLTSASGTQTITMNLPTNSIVDKNWYEHNTCPSNFFLPTIIFLIFNCLCSARKVNAVFYPKILQMVPPLCKPVVLSLAIDASSLLQIHLYRLM